MIKRLITIIVAAIIAASYPLSAEAELIVVEFSKNKHTKNGQMVYQLDFKRGDAIIAKRALAAEN